MVWLFVTVCVMSVAQIHTPDSSRYWLADSYESRLAAGQEPQNIDKEFLRLWFRACCDPYKDKVRSRTWGGVWTWGGRGDCKQLKGLRQVCFESTLP
jgi:hypothetical protein